MAEHLKWVPGEKLSKKEKAERFRQKTVGTGRKKREDVIEHNWEKKQKSGYLKSSKRSRFH